MSWNGSGTFNRSFSWQADKAAGLNISSSRMDSDTNDLASNGFGNCLTRDGQGSASANLPMNGFRHTGVANGSARTDYAALGQLQDGLTNWTIAGGSSDAITATYTPALTTLVEGQLCFVRAIAANATTTPTFSPNGLTAHTITKAGGQPLAVGDIAGNRYEMILRYNSTGVNQWELMNPSNVAALQGTATTGDIKPTFKASADPGWLMLNDSTMGSAASGASSSSDANQALFIVLFNNISDTSCPLLTSTGSATTRAAQGTAAAAWAANCRMTLPKALGRALAAAGSGSGLTARALGSTTGNETATLATANLPPYTPSVSLSGGQIQLGWATNNANWGGGSNQTVTALANVGTGNTLTITTSNGFTLPTVNVGAQGGTSTPFGLMQPTFFTNFMIKL
ncbi:hypothetical protein [Bradyrhizobium sp. STM 3561]|uniref:hypothetical protein n=1 Tax=Bradyrhizobium sp. STM 3561 TaxID=578923 RepID=UPI00388F97C8